MKKLTLILFVAVLTVVNSYSQSARTLQLADGATSPKATIDQVAWIAGHWAGEAFGGKTEEVWTKPSSGSMMGSFKAYNEEGISFYEFCLIREVDETLILQLKHFHGDLKGWEEKDVTVDFPLVKIEKEKVYFSGFTFEKISDEQMDVYVVIGKEHQEMKFEYFAESSNQ